MRFQETVRIAWPPIVAVVGSVAVTLQWGGFSGLVQVVGTGPTLVLSAVLAALLVAAAWAVARLRGDETASQSDERSSPHLTRRELRLAVGIVTVATVWLMGYHLAVPLAVAGSVRAGLFIATVTSFVAMFAVLTIAVRWEDAALMDGGLGLLSLGICGLAASAVPSYPASLAERYPVVLTAMVAGFALATWLCAWLGLHFSSGRIINMLGRIFNLDLTSSGTPTVRSVGSSGPEEGILVKEGARLDFRTSRRAPDRASKKAIREHSLGHSSGLVERWSAMDVADHFRRFAFLNAALGVLVANLMSVWPRLRWIGIPDDSLGRVTAGFGVHLLLLLVLLWTARRTKLITLHVLSVVAVVSSAGFLLMRAYPYTPQFQ